jgi:hypothetical protein
MGFKNGCQVFEQHSPALFPPGEAAPFDRDKAERAGIGRRAGVGNAFMPVDY